MSDGPVDPPLLQYLGRPLYWLAGLLIGASLLDLILNIWPPSPGTPSWRYASEGLFSGSLPALALGFLLLNTLALLGRKHRLLRRLVHAHAGFALLYLILAADFAFNAWQLREGAVPDLRDQLVFDVGAVKVVAKYLVTGTLQVLAALATWRWLVENPKPGRLDFGGPKRPWWLFWWPDPAPPRGSGSSRRPR